jgi:LmbE family N-acetylglucosaminyl deacetylase
MLTDRDVTLFLLAHPDDEFFCSVFIQDELAKERRVIVAYLTDGGWGGQSVRRRIDESLAVLARLGVPSSDVHFVGAERSIPDGALPNHMQSAYEAVKRVVGESDLRIYTTAWEGGHQDHDACHAIATRLALHHGVTEVYQFPLYNAAGARPPLFNVMSALQANGCTEARMLTWSERASFLRNAFSYPSQWKTWLGLLPFATLRLLTEGRIIRQQVQGSRLHKRPHEGPLLYERRGHGKFAQIEQCVAAFMKVGDSKSEPPT